MHLAILVTNTDDSAFADRHPRDARKFSDLVHLARPDWTTEAFIVRDGEFPDAPGRFDGLILTGSPASVHDPAPWVAQLLGLIRAAHDARRPMFGACFGHQAIAVALGGTVAANPGGWVHGSIANRVLARSAYMRDLPDPLRLYACHSEQVTALPEGAQVLMSSPGCPVAGFAVGTHIYTTQHHPEMSPDFIAALTEELADMLGPTLTAQARESLQVQSDQAEFAQSIARFFEAAHA